MSIVTAYLYARMCALSLLILIALASCTERTQTATAGKAGVVAIGKVTSVSPLPSGETANRKRWRVAVEMVQIVQGRPSVKIGDIVTVQVHSVVKAFGDDTSSIIGKSYRITYADMFAGDYAGEFIAEPEKGTTPSTNTANDSRR